MQTLKSDPHKSAVQASSYYDDTMRMGHAKRMHNSALLSSTKVGMEHPSAGIGKEARQPGMPLDMCIKVTG